MKDVSTSYEESGRSQQKRRTRDQLIDATRTLIAENGAAPTVAEAAAAARISRTTAYRYFPNQTALLVAAHPETAAASLLPPGVGGGAEERLAAAVKAFHDLIIDTETQQRTMLMLSLQPGDSARSAAAEGSGDRLVRGRAGPAPGPVQRSGTASTRRRDPQRRRHRVDDLAHRCRRV